MYGADLFGATAMPETYPAHVRPLLPSPAHRPLTFAKLTVHKAPFVLNTSLGMHESPATCCCYEAIKQLSKLGAGHSQI